MSFYSLLKFQLISILHVNAIMVNTLNRSISNVLALEKGILSSPFWKTESLIISAIFTGNLESGLNI